ncbi:MAG: hypothetical protein WAV90_21685 [Gordonia amarae]
MASDFEYTGVQNQQAGFRERNSGVQHWLQTGGDIDVELRDGDEVVITSGGQRNVWSIRQQRIIGYA